ncbi:MAG: hypothetical protein O7D95_01270 [Betaproteobacteria bacterium]|nr:hypothetical protein [Betaproteobacteria bacterium]
MARTETLQVVRDRWAVLCGLDSDNLIDDDARDFFDLANIALNKAWHRSEWPFSIKTFPKLNDKYGFVDLSSDTEISEVLRAYDSYPYRFRTTREFNKVIPVEDAMFDGVYVPGVSEPVVVSVTSITRSGTTVTVTTTTDHGLQEGQAVVIAGAVETDYNGTFDVASVTSSTVYTYEISTTPTTPATGTITSTGATVYLLSRIRETVLSSLTDTVPYKLWRYIAYKASADWLKAEGQEEKSRLREQEAEDVILDEIDRLERQQQWLPPLNANPRVKGVR